MSVQFAQQANFVAATVTSGADEDADTAWTLELTGANGLDSGLMTTDGRSIHLFLENGLIVGRYDRPGDGNDDVTSSDPAAFALHISKDGTLSIAQYVSIKHDDKADHDEANDADDNNSSTALQTLAGKINAVVTVTDFDGDKAISKVEVGGRIQFEDDGPVASGNAVTKTADEDDLYNLLSQGTSPDWDSQFALLGGGLAATTSGSVGTVVNFGADGAAPSGGFSLTSNAAATMALLGLTSKGGTLSYQVSGNTILAFVNNDSSAGFDFTKDRPVFSLALNGETGEFSYRQFDQLDHVDGNGENTALKTATGSIPSINFGAIIEAKDGDGDTVNLNGKLSIVVKDDVPEVCIEVERSVTVDETGGIRDDNTTAPEVIGLFLNVANKGTDSDMATPVYARADVIDTDYEGGADDNVTTSLTLRIDNAASGLKTTDGSDITLVLENGVVVGRVGANGPAAFAVAIDASGKVSIAQYMSLKHPNANNTDEPISLTNKISAVFSATDFDKDTSTTSVSIGSKIVFEDDAPSQVSPATGATLDEDDLANGNDASKELLTATGNLNVKLGADGGSIALSAQGATWTSGNKTLTAGDGSWTIELKADGSYDFKLLKNTLAHGPGNNGQNDLKIDVSYVATDGDLDKLDGKFTITIVDDEPVVIGNVTSGLTLNEDDLVGGNDDAAPRETLSLTGDLNISLGADGGSVSLSASNATWSANDKTLTANDGSWKITLNNNGTYKFDLLDNTLAHAPGDNLENTFTVDVTYTAKDGDGDIKDGTFQIKIVDDVPVAVGESANVRESAPSTVNNLILTFDVSGSMDDKISGNQTRLDIARAAAVNLINLSNAAQVLIVTFSDNASNTIWLSKTAAIAYINGGSFPDADGGTDYDKVIDHIQDINLPTSGNTSLYFFSDGDPNNGDDLSNSERLAWESYLQTNGIKSYAVGVGVSANDEDLKDVAYPGEPISITSPTDPILTGTVVPSVPTSASGNVLTNDSFGADGGRIQSIVVDGQTYVWNGADGTKILNVTTALGGSLTFNFKTGEWTYNAPAQVVSNTPETFTYTLVDGDGDTITASLVVNVEAVNDAPVNQLPPSSLNALEDTELSISGVQVSDPDAGNGNITVKLEVEDGKLSVGSLNGVAVSGNNSDTLSLTGTVANINTLLGGLKYKGDLNFNGTDELKITTTDNGNTGIGGAKSDVDKVTINVAPVNDAPVLTPDARQIEFRENGDAVDLFKNVDLEDPDNPSNFNGGSVEISLGNTAVSGDQLVLNDSDFRVSGSNVQIWTGWSSGWSTIGTIVNGGFGQTTIKINLGSGATEERIEELLEAVAFRSTSENPTDATRTVTVTFNDGGNIGGGPLSDSSVISVEVKPVNDAPIFTGGDDRYFEINENGTTVGTVAATDVDGGALTYSILQSNDTDWSKFNIDPTTGALSFKTAPNFENPTDQNQNNKYWVEVQVSDGRGGFDRQMIEIDVKNVNEKPTDINLSASTVVENVVGATIGTLSTVDPDVGNSHSYTVSDNRFEVVGNQLKLKSGISLDYESEQSVDVTITTKDGGNLTHQETFTITVQDGADKQTGTSGNNTLNGTGGADILDGKEGNDTINGANGDDILLGGAGNDTLTGGTGNDQFRFSSTSGTDRVTDYVDGQDKIAFFDNGSSSNGSVNFRSTTGTIQGNALNSADFVSRSSIFDIEGSGTDSYRVVRITNAQSEWEIRNVDPGTSARTDIYVLVFNSDTGRGEIWFDNNWASAGDRIKIATLDNVTTLAALNNITAADIVVYSNAADPIVLDLDKNGFAFSSVDTGVTFDIDADGHKDQIAWTKDDGILAYDVDGDGVIDNGSEIFTPDFNGGKFASGVAALASLDSNGDGKIDASDEAFSKLQVWVDADNDGVSDAGELSSLADHHVASISLSTDQSGGLEDGQTIFAEGEFTFDDGSTGNFLEVGFDTIFGADVSEGLTLHGGMGEVVMTGSAGADTFVFDGTALDELDVADVITDFSTEEGDVLDVTALLDSLLGEQASVDTAASHLRATVDDGNTTVSVQTAPDTWKDVVVLQNHDTAIKVLFDDKHATITPHD